MNTNFLVGVVVGAAVLFGLNLIVPGYGASSGQQFWQKATFLQGFTAGTRDEFSVDNDGDIVLTKSTFCMNFYATSTATLVKMVASSTATIEGTDGVMVMQYGSCS